MFEAAELGREVSKEAYAAEVAELRFALLQAQYRLRDADFPVVLMLSGDDRFGCNETLNVLHEWLDARLLETHAFDAPTDEERERPEFWRYWRVLPPRGRIGLYMGAWTLRAVRDRLGKRIPKAAFERALERMVRFEKMLVDDGALVLKFWLHVPKRELRRRLDRAAKHPEKAWWVEEVDRRLHDSYEKAMATVERALRKTSTGEAPWTIVEATDPHWRNLAVGRALLQALERRLAEPPPERSVTAASAAAAATSDPYTILDTVDLSSKLDKAEYDARFERALSRLKVRTLEAKARGITSLIVLEGSDAAGKGSVIRRLTRAMNAQLYRIVQIAAPSAEEKARHYLWRFWIRLPRAGHVVVFDRSWYGRVLVERVEGFATEPEWRRAYSEINEFEEQLWEGGCLLLKFWLHVDPDEQLRRFEERERTPFKQYKITEEDYRNRAKRPEYEIAANEMIARTSTEFAPWHLVPSNDKRRARIQVLETYADALGLKLEG